MDGLLLVHQSWWRCARPCWSSSPLEGRSGYSREFREAMGGGVVRGGFDSYVRPEQIVNRARQE